MFEHEERDLKVMVHGDDFVTLGLEEQIKWFHESMQSTYEVTIRGMLGPEVGDDKRIEILNRVVEWGADGITYEGDPRHAIALIKGMGVEQGKGVAAPGVKSKDDEDLEKSLIGKKLIFDAIKYKVVFR